MAFLRALLLGALLLGVTACVSARATDSADGPAMGVLSASPPPVGGVPAAAPETHAPVSPAARPDACAGRPAARSVLVDLSRQHLWMCSHGRTVRDTPITSGKDTPDTRTPLGRFRIEGRARNTTLTLNTGSAYDVDYWIPFQAPVYGFHDSSWQHFPYGSPRYRKAGSHGCVHMPLKAIAFLYRWARVGTPVTIRT